MKMKLFDLSREDENLEPKLSLEDIDSKDLIDIALENINDESNTEKLMSKLDMYAVTPMYRYANTVMTNIMLDNIITYMKTVNGIIGLNHIIYKEVQGKLEDSGAPKLPAPAK